MKQDDAALPGPGPHSHTHAGGHTVAVTHPLCDAHSNKAGARKGTAKAGLTDGATVAV